MRLPRELSKFDGKAVPEASDQALVKLSTLKAMMAFIIRLIPIPGGGLAVRRSLDGDVWALTAEAQPFQISSKGKVHPGLINGIMPTLGGDDLDATTNVIDLTQDGDKVWFKLQFSLTWVESYLGSWALTSVTVEQGSAVPADDADTKYLHFNTITKGAPAASFFLGSFSVVLYDNGVDDTLLVY